MSSSSPEAVAALALAALVLFTATDAPIATRKSATASAADRWAAQVVRGTDWTAMTRCNLAAQTSYERQSRALTMATVAVESRVRPAWVRGLKSAAAHAQLVAFGTLPDISLGVAQVKPLTAAAWTTSPTLGANPPSPDRLWSMLSDDCASLRLVYRYYTSRPNEDAREKVAVFNGQAPQRAHDPANLYVAVVMAVADRALLPADRAAEARTDKPNAPSMLEASLP